MFDLKPISTDAIPRALAKAEQYRLLNEPREAESICRDILRAEPDHTEAPVVMLLALTDQFAEGHRVNVKHAQELLDKLRDDYAKAYYAGVICERWGKAQLKHGAPGSVVYDWFVKAMTHYEEAQQLAPSGNDDAILRANTCARTVKRNAEVRPQDQDSDIHAGFEEEVPW